MKSDKKQTLFMIGIALLFFAGILLYVAQSAPKVYKSADFKYTIESTTAAVSVSYPLDINKASVDELKTIEGLSEGVAVSIVSYRKEIGGYTDVSQIKNIKGVSDKVYYEIFPYLEV